MNQVWTERVSSGSIISFHIEDFEFEKNDGLKIYDCDFNLLWDSWHSSWNQQYFKTPSNCAKIWMYTDYAVQRRGFSLVWWAESKY